MVLCITTVVVLPVPNDLGWEGELDKVRLKNAQGIMLSLPREQEVMAYLKQWI